MANWKRNVQEVTYVTTVFTCFFRTIQIWMIIEHNVIFNVLAGLGDALGVDWASLVADVRRREQTSVSSGGARERWRPERVLARLGLSINMAGKEIVQDVIEKNAESLHTEKKNAQAIENPEQKDIVEQNGTHENEENPENVPDISTLHPVAAIQVPYTFIFLPFTVQKLSQ